jgi:hypothetical protein
MDEQRYWRTQIAREIKAEHDRVKKYYSQRGRNSGGITKEEQTRLNIFALCQSIVETYNEDIVPVNKVEPKPRKPRVKKEPSSDIQAPQVQPETIPQNTPEPVIQAISDPEPIEQNIEEDIIEEPLQEPQGIQNEFGEFI